MRTHTKEIPGKLRGQMCIGLRPLSSMSQQEKKTLSEMQDCPTTTHYSTTSSTNKEKTMRFLNELCFYVVIITIPSLSNIHQSAAFYQK